MIASSIGNQQKFRKKYPLIPVYMLLENMVLIGRNLGLLIMHDNTSNYVAVGYIRDSMKLFDVLLAKIISVRKCKRFDCIRWISKDSYVNKAFKRFEFNDLQGISRKDYYV